MNIGKFSFEAIASEFGTHAHCIERWVVNLDIKEEDIELALSGFTKRQRHSMMIEYLKPSQLLIDNAELINHVQRVPLEVIKGLSESDFEEHLSALKNADNISDRLNKRAFPYNSYDSEVLLSLRKATKKGDLKFIRQMFVRKISHHSYPKARVKLRELALN